MGAPQDRPAGPAEVRFRVVQLEGSAGTDAARQLNEYDRQGWACRSLEWIHAADVHHGSWWALLENERRGSDMEPLPSNGEGRS